MFENLKNKWGVFTWFEEDGDDVVHPLDINNFRNNFPSVTLYECIDSQEPYISISNGRNTFRVKPHLFKVVDKVPSKKVGQTVLIKKGGKKVSALVSGIVWHFQRSVEYYSLEVDGKILKKRYWNDDFLDSD